MKMFLTIGREQCLKRRLETDNEITTDYFKNCIWPSYLERNWKIFHMDDVLILDGEQPKEKLVELACFYIHKIPVKIFKSLRERMEREDDLLADLKDSITSCGHDPSTWTSLSADLRSKLRTRHLTKKKCLELLSSQNKIEKLACLSYLQDRFADVHDQNDLFDKLLYLLHNEPTGDIIQWRVKELLVSLLKSRSLTAFQAGQLKSYVQFMYRDIDVPSNSSSNFGSASSWKDNVLGIMSGYSSVDSQSTRRYRATKSRFVGCLIGECLGDSLSLLSRTLIHEWETSDSNSRPPGVRKKNLLRNFLHKLRGGQLGEFSPQIRGSVGCFSEDEDISLVALRDFSTKGSLSLKPIETQRDTRRIM